MGFAPLSPPWRFSKIGANFRADEAEIEAFPPIPVVLVHGAGRLDSRSDAPPAVGGWSPSLPALNVVLRPTAWSPHGPIKRARVPPKCFCPRHRASRSIEAAAKPVSGGFATPIATPCHRWPEAEDLPREESGTGLLQTRRWRKTDSNPRSPRRGQHFRGGSELYPLPINHGIGLCRPTQPGR
jgi:hypothetical protein